MQQHFESAETQPPVQTAEVDPRPQRLVAPYKHKGCLWDHANTKYFFQYVLYGRQLIDQIEAVLHGEINFLAQKQRETQMLY